MKFAILIVLLFTTLVSSPIFAQNWLMDADHSRINFVTIKKGNIAETHRFGTIRGSIVDGKANIIIDAVSVDTRVPIRNDRMAEFLFETQLYPKITVSADVNALLQEHTEGNSHLVSLPVIVSMHGTSKEHEISVRLSQVGKNTLIVSSTEPVLVRAADYGMVAGIRKLSSLVNNLPIAESVPVNFSLQFAKEPE